MNFKRIVICTVLSCLPAIFVNPVHGQVTGEWISADIAIDLPKGFDFGIEGEARYYNFKGIHTDKYFVDFGLDYKINARWDLSVSYRHIQNMRGNRFYTRHRYYFDIDYDNSWKRFEYTYRIRMQREHRKYIEDAFDAIPANEWRNKFEVAMDLDSDIKPYVAYELFIPVNRFTPFRVVDSRTRIGIGLPFTNDHEIDVAIQYDKELYPEASYSFTLRLAYSFNIN